MCVLQLNIYTHNNHDTVNWANTNQRTYTGLWRWHHLEQHGVIMLILSWAQWAVPALPLSPPSSSFFLNLSRISSLHDFIFLFSVEEVNTFRLRREETNQVPLFNVAQPEHTLFYKVRRLGGYGLAKTVQNETKLFHGCPFLRLNCEM